MMSVGRAVGVFENRSEKSRIVPAGRNLDFQMHLFLTDNYNNTHLQYEIVQLNMYINN